MTHNELLAKVNSYLIPTKAHLEQPNFAVNTLEALRAVVELHKPIGSHDVCKGCETKFYPCPTIKTIEKEFINA